MANRRVASMGFIGAGQMATALAVGFLRAGFIDQNNMIASATSESSPSLLKLRTHGVNIAKSNSEVVEKSQVIWLVVKPHSITKVLREVAPVIKCDHHIVISAAAGIPLKTLEKNLPERCKVFRAMPNTPVILQNGVTIHASGSHVTEDDKQLLLDLLSAIGIAMEMKEHYMDIMTALSGGGPSFMYMIMDALADGGVYAGVPKDLALKITAHTMIGSARMVLDNGQHPQELKDYVCSPAGTAIQGVRYLERSGFRGIMMDAVHESSMRAIELSKLENGPNND